MSSIASEIDTANRKAVERILSAEATLVDWKPPAGGDQDMIKLLDRLGT